MGLVQIRAMAFLSLSECNGFDMSLLLVGLLVVLCYDRFILFLADKKPDFSVARRTWRCSRLYFRSYFAALFSDLIDD